MGPQGLYLNKWTPDFDPAVDVPSAVPIWVRLPNLPVHCWNCDSLKHIGNTLGKFIDRANNKDQYDCARICVEVDLEVGLPEAIKINVGSWTHVQKLDYEQLPFKCRKCHVYSHFARGCPTNGEAEKGKEEGWNQIKRTKTHKPHKSGAPTGKGPQLAPTQQIPPLMGKENNWPLSSQLEETQEVEIQKVNSPAKETPFDSIKGGSAAESSKEKLSEAEEEDQESEDLEEEGEIGDSQTSAKRSTRGRKIAQEKRE